MTKKLPFFEKKACQKVPIHVELFFDGGCSSVGRAPGCGLGGRGFKPHHSPHKFCPVFLQGFFCFFCQIRLSLRLKIPINKDLQQTEFTSVADEACDSLCRATHTTKRYLERIL